MILSHWFSIHAPRMGSDCIPHNLNRDGNYFNSRSPHGGRWICIFTSTQILKFQFTLPVWGATRPSCMVLISKNFQFTLLVWGASSGFCIFSVTALFFQFTLPGWGAIPSALPENGAIKVSIHAPRRGSDDDCYFGLR